MEIDEEFGMPSKHEFRELVPISIAVAVAAIGAFGLWSDLKDDPLDRGNGQITSAVVSRAGATLAPSEAPPHLNMRQTVLASGPTKANRVTR